MSETFVVKHYSFDERPSLKGNGFDGLQIGEDREEAEAFVNFVNERMAEIERAVRVALEYAAQTPGRTAYGSADVEAVFARLKEEQA
jgi:hypothetical protein